MTPTVFRQNVALVQPEFRPLHKYLDERYANRVVLTLSEIEDVLGAALPEVAKRSDAWWLDEGEETGRQCQTWRQAQRTAVPRLKAGTVTFERTSG
jgi:hypothetical protein